MDLTLGKEAFWGGGTNLRCGRLSEGIRGVGYSTNLLAVLSACGLEVQYLYMSLLASGCHCHMQMVLVLVYSFDYPLVLVCPFCRGSGGETKNT